MKRNVRVLLAMLVMLVQPARAFMIPSYPIELRKADRQRLEQLACIKPHGVTAASIDARTYERGNPTQSYAHIECKPHGSFRQKPMHYTAFCEASVGGWNCEKGNLRIVVPVDDREIIVSPGGYEPGFAYDTISKVARAGTFQGCSCRDCEIRLRTVTGNGERMDRYSVRRQHRCDGLDLVSAVGMSADHIDKPGFALIRPRLAPESIATPRGLLMLTYR